MMGKSSARDWPKPTRAAIRLPAGEKLKRSAIMPEEPDVSHEEMEILDRVWSKRTAARKREREEEKISVLANRIRAAFQSRPDGMSWQEIRGMFDKNHSVEQIRQALVSLMHAPVTMTTQKIKETEEHSS
jgi:hypothetical protein